MPGGFKLGGMTLRSLFSKPTTVSYPATPQRVYPATRGHVEIDIEKCIQCGSCARNCPSDSLTVDKQAYSWSINRYSCVQCKCCILVCPTKCLTMGPEYAPSAEEKHIDVYALGDEEIAKREADKAAKKKAALEAAAKKKAASTA